MGEALLCADCQETREKYAREVEGAGQPTLDGVPETGLVQWWRHTADREIQLVVPKAIEYGSTDLVEIGRSLRLSGIQGEQHETSDEELGIYFYMVGKMARWTDAIRHGRKVSDDTIFDIGIYARMVQRVRESGGWPGEVEHG